jgi:DNA polymerase elongation subunit (family B)
MVHHFTYERFDLKDKYKATGDKYYSDREQASKVIINSAYGLMATPGLNFNCTWIARKITESTRQMIDMSLRWASGKDSEFYMKEDEVSEEM